MLGKGYKDELAEYQSVFVAEEPGGEEQLTVEQVEMERTKIIRGMSDIEQVASLDKRWITSWERSPLAK